MQPIKIDSISQSKVKFGIMVTILDGDKKYNFFNTKKDGTKTRAYQQYEKYGFKIGDTVQAEVKEEQKEGEDIKKGKTFTYTQRTILYFQEVENTPVVKSDIQKVISLEDRVARLEGIVLKKELIEDGIEIPDNDLPF